MSGQHDDDDDDQYNEGEEEELPLAELANATVPTDVKSIRACKRCGLLKTVEQFYTNGCENCEEFLDMADNIERVNSCTTAFFEGQAAIMDPRESWAARWIRADNFLPGVYAITVTGQLDPEIEEHLENQGVRWRCRPASSS